MPLKSFSDVLSGIQSCVVVGDYLLDCYQFGDVSRISPEAPVPVFKFQRQEFRPGGAGNIVQNLHALGVSSECIGLIGNDTEGECLGRLLLNMKADIQAILKMQLRPTSLKTRLISKNQQIVRVDREDSSPLSVSERDLLNACIKSLVSEGSHVFVSDYGKGVIGLNTVQVIRESDPRAWISVDPKGQAYEKYRGCSLITPNQNEAELSTAMLIHDENDVATCLRRLHDITRAPFICMTRHENGMTLYEAKNDTITHQPAWSRRDVYDVTGAGDTVLVFLSLALWAGLPVQEALVVASAAAYVVIQKFGASVATLAELDRVLTSSTPSEPSAEVSKHLGFVSETNPS